MKQKVYDFLNSQNINYEVTDHAPVYTMEEMQAEKEKIEAERLEKERLAEIARQKAEKRAKRKRRRIKMKQIKVALIGAGNRGLAYTDNMQSLGEEYFKVTAVCDPDEKVRNVIKDKHSIPDEMCFKSYDEFFDMGKVADAVIIATMDDLHLDPALKAIELGYDILLEKPVCPTAQDCVKIANAAKEKGVKILVCHVLRYTMFYRMIKEAIKKYLESVKK